MTHVAPLALWTLSDVGASARNTVTTVQSEIVSIVHLLPLLALLGHQLSKNAILSDLDERQTSSEAPARKYSVHSKPIASGCKQFFIQFYHPNHGNFWRNMPVTGFPWD